MSNSDKKETTIIVNTREHVWGEHKISYEQVVVLAFGSIDSNPDTIYTVTFKKGPENKEGSLVAGKDTPVKDGMIFNVSRTNRS